MYCVCVPKYNQLSLYILCIFSGLTDTEQPIGVHVPGEDHFSCSQIHLFASMFLCRIEAFWVFPHPVWSVHWCYPCSVRIWAVMLVRPYRYLMLLGDRITQKSPGSSGCYSLSIPSSSQWSLRVSDKGVYYRCIHLDSDPQLWILIGCGFL